MRRPRPDLVSGGADADPHVLVVRRHRDGFALPRVGELVHYQIELLSDLDKVPEAGALVVVAFPKPRMARGFRRACSRSSLDLRRSVFDSSFTPISGPSVVFRRRLH